MSTLPDNELDLEKLFLPAWAQEQPSSVKYANYEGEEERPERRGDRRGPRPARREGSRGPRREGNREGRERRGEGREWRGQGRGEGFRPRGERQGPPGAERERGQPGAGRQERFGARRDERREPPPPLPEVNLSLVPEDKGVDSLARQIRMTGRAYPLFDIAQMILQRPERVVAAFGSKTNAEGQPVQPLFVCALDDTLWLSEDEAISHVLRKHFGTFYQAERTATEPPKGKYTFVAQCGLSGTVLGPPNYHDYQNQLRKLHAERFSRMPFEVYKSRVKIVRDEEIVKKWVEDQSWRTEFLCLNLPEPLRLGNMEAVEKHFRETHKENIIKPVESHKLSGAAARSLRSLELSRLVRVVWEDQRRFPLQIATVLSQQFAQRGLQFFKVNKTVTHVCVARPHYLDLELTPVSENVKRIVEFINAHPKATRRRLLEALAPSPAPTPAPPASVPAEGQPIPAAPPPVSAEPTPEQNALISDLHWLVHQGHVIEFANGILETAKKPLPKPPKPEPKPADRPPEAAQAIASVPATEAPAAPAETEPAPAPPVEAVASDNAPAPTESAAGAPVNPLPAEPSPSATEPPDAQTPTPATVAAPGEPSTAS